MKLATIGEVVIGEGRPKICVSLTGKDLSEVLTQGQAVSETSADIVEWRLDFLKPEIQVEDILEALPTVSSVTKRPILLTFRTAKEGGERVLSDADYWELCRNLIESPLVTALDLEASTAGVGELIALAKRYPTTIVLSKHDFAETPAMTEIVGSLQQMASLGGDVAKLAVMPQTPDDVVRLLASTVEASKTCDIPIVTMSMGRLGKVSRVSGAIFGSAMTFGAVGAVSAPGQLKVEALAEMLEQLD